MKAKEFTNIWKVALDPLSPSNYVPDIWRFLAFVKE